MWGKSLFLLLCGSISAISHPGRRRRATDRCVPGKMASALSGRDFNMHKNQKRALQSVPFILGPFRCESSNEANFCNSQRIIFDALPRMFIFYPL